MTEDTSNTEQASGNRQSARLLARNKGKGPQVWQQESSEDEQDTQEQNSGLEDQEPNATAGPSRQTNFMQPQNSTNPTPSLFRKSNNRQIEQDQMIEILKAVQGHSSMPIPSSNLAPRFRGSNLRHFLEDYNIAAEGAGWSDEKKCENLYSYCGHRTRDMVRKLPERKNLDWVATKKRLSELYIAEEHTDKYSRDKLSRFVRKRRTIKGKKDFVAYFRDFSQITQNLRASEKMSEEDKNGYFWKGIPTHLQKDIHSQLRSRNTEFSPDIAQPISTVRKTALEILNPNALYAAIINSQPHRKSSSKSKSQNSESTRFKSKHRGHHSQSDSSSDSSLSEESSEESSSSESESDHKSSKKKRHHHTTSDSNDESDFDLKPRSRNHVRFASTPREDRTRSPSSKEPVTSPSPSQNNNSMSPQSILQLANALSAQGRQNPQIMSGELHPDVLLKALRLVANEVSESRNDLHTLMDSRALYRGNDGTLTTGRCFFCRETGTHAIGVRNCPQAHQMIREGYCIEKNGRVMLQNEDDLPRLRQGENMIETIRRTAPRSGRNNNSRLPPPPTPRVSIAEVAYNPPIFTSYDEDPSEYFESDYESEEAISTQGYYQAMVAEQEEGEKKRVQFESKPGRQPEIMKRPTRVEVEMPPHGTGARTLQGNQTGQKGQSRPQPTEFTIQENPPYQKPPPTPKFATPPNSTPLNPNHPRPFGRESSHPVEKSNQEGERRRNNSKFDNIPGPPRIPMEYPEKRMTSQPARPKLTTLLRERYTNSSTYINMLETPVNLTLGELLSLSPEMEKSINAETRLRSPTVPPEPQIMPRASMIEYEYDEFGNPSVSVMNAKVNDSEDWGYPTTHQPFDEILSDDENSSDDEDFVASGVCYIRIGQFENIRAMVDTGAEVNLINTTLAEKLRKRYPTMGTYTSVKNISGSSTQMKGRFAKIPISVGKITHKEALFIANNWNSTYDIVLGAPFMKHASSTIEYQDNEQTLYVYPRRSRKIPHPRKCIPVEAVLVPSRILSRNPEISMNEVADQVQTAEVNPFMVPSSVPGEEEYFERRKREIEEDREAYIWGEREESSGSEERTRQWATRATRFRILPPKKLINNDEQFSEVLSHIRNESQKDLQPLSHEALTSLYHGAQLNRTFHIRIGDKLLPLIPGRLNARIGHTLVKIIFDPEIYHNIITTECAKNVKLDIITIGTMLGNDMDTSQRTNFVPFVPLHFNGTPTLPGVFLTTNERIPGGIDLILGRPWIIGVENRYEGYRVNNQVARPIAPSYRKTHRNVLPFPPTPSRNWTPLDPYEIPSEDEEQEPPKPGQPPTINNDNGDDNERTRNRPDFVYFDPTATEDASRFNHHQAESGAPGPSKPREVNTTRQPVQVSNEPSPLQIASNDRYIPSSESEPSHRKSHTMSRIQQKKPLESRISPRKRVSKYDEPVKNDDDIQAHPSPQNLYFPRQGMQVIIPKYWLMESDGSNSSRRLRVDAEKDTESNPPPQPRETQDRASDFQEQSTNREIPMEEEPIVQSGTLKSSDEDEMMKSGDNVPEVSNLWTTQPPRPIDHPHPPRVNDQLRNFARPISKGTPEKSTPRYLNNRPSLHTTVRRSNKPSPNTSRPPRVQKPITPAQIPISYRQITNENDDFVTRLGVTAVPSIHAGGGHHESWQERYQPYTNDANSMTSGHSESNELHIERTSPKRIEDLKREEQQNNTDISYYVLDTSTKSNGNDSRRRTNSNLNPHNRQKVRFATNVELMDQSETQKSRPRDGIDAIQVTMESETSSKNDEGLVEDLLQGRDSVSTEEDRNLSDTTHHIAPDMEGDVQQRHTYDEKLHNTLDRTNPFQSVDHHTKRYQRNVPRIPAQTSPLTERPEHLLEGDGHPVSDGAQERKDATALSFLRATQRLVARNNDEEKVVYTGATSRKQTENAEWEIPQLGSKGPGAL